MKKTFKQLISVLLSLMLVFGALPMTVLAANGTCGSGVYWTLTDGTLAITGNGQMDNYSSTTDAPWQEYADEITAVTVAGTVTKIGNYAFWGIEGITSVTLNEGLQNIGTYVFNYCTGLTELELPASLDGIGNAAFGNSGIKKITFNGNYMSAVGNNTFKTISNAKIIVPAGFEIGGNYGGTAVAAKTGAQPFYNNYVGFSNGKATVYWENEGTVLETDTNVTAGTLPAYGGETPTKAATDTAEYTFAEWSPAVEAAAANEIYVYSATFTETAIVPPVTSYTVTWTNWDGTVLETDENVAEGTMPEYNGETPTRPDDGYIIFAFAGWDPEVSSVTDDVTYTATFTDSVAPHTHTYDNYSVYWNWNSYESASADLICTICGELRTETATVTSETLSNRIVHTASVTVDGTTYTNTKNESITKQVSYIDANGDEQTVTATVLSGYESWNYYDYSATYFLGEEGQTTWYVVEDDVVYNDSLSDVIRIKGNVNLILADGASLTCDEIKTPYTDNARSLSIYGQSAGTGTLITDSITRYYQFDELNIYGGSITTSEVDRVDTVNILSGTVDVGTLESDSVTLGCRTACDSITVDTYTVDYYAVSIADGQTLSDGTDTYSGTIHDASVLARKTLRLYQEQPVITAQDKYNLTVQENIDVNILVDVNGHAADGEVIEKIVYTYPDVTTQSKNTITETVNADEITTDESGFFAKSFTMAVAQANEPITATIYFTGGTTKEIKVSVADYCKYIIENAEANSYPEKLVNLCYAVLEYCKNAADYFNYSYDAYPEYILPSYFDAEPEIASQAGIKKGDVVTGIASTQMFILSKATMRLTFKDDLSAVEVVSAKIGDKALAAEKVKNNGKYSVDISGIYATDLSKPMLLELSDGTKVQYAATDWAKSILTYSTNAQSKALAKSLYYYSKAANDYFA